MSSINHPCFGKLRFSEEEGWKGLIHFPLFAEYEVAESYAEDELTKENSAVGDSSRICGDKSSLPKANSSYE